MDMLPKVGRYLFAIPFAVFGVFHFMNTEAMVGMVPVPGGALWIYLSGVALIAASVAMLTGKFAVLATRLLALFLLATGLTVWLPVVLGGDQSAMSNVLKDLALAGAALVLSGVYADESTAAEPAREASTTGAGYEP